MLERVGIVGLVVKACKVINGQPNFPCNITEDDWCSCNENMGRKYCIDDYD